MIDEVFQLGLNLKSPKSKPINDLCRLFHYTKDESKQKIVENKEVSFLFKRLDKFLDKNEGIHILEPYYYVCGDLYEDKKIDEQFYKLLMSVESKEFKKTTRKAWVICFSKNGNSNFMKRRYAARNGWILGLNLSAIDDMCINFPIEFGNLDLFEVEYSFDTICNELKLQLEEYYKCYLKILQSNNGSMTCSLNKKIKKQLLLWLSEYAIIYKSVEYKHEEEIRLVCRLNDDFFSCKQEEKNINIKLEEAKKDKITMKMILDKKYLTYETQELNESFDVKSNKTLIIKKNN